jgi:hypothetical protein
VTGAWRRLGRLALDTSRAPWAATHAALPAADRLDDARWALYLSARDAQGRPRIGRTVLTLHPVPSLGPLEPEPVLDLGPLGTFDDSGVTVSCIVDDGRRKLLYYTGWTRGVTVPFYLFAGLAVSDNGGRTFARWSPAPLLERAADDPYLTASPFVLIDGARWRMWYVSGTGWEADAGGNRHSYRIRCAESADGVHWTRAPRPAIDYAGPDEHALSRPVVVRDPDGYRMWFAHRGRAYRIGAAYSRDGHEWVRRDEDGLAPSGTGWDSDAVAYPWILDADGRRYMLYNGNDYGRTGVGLAVQAAGGGTP